MARWLGPSVCVLLGALALGCAGARERGVREVSVHRFAFGALGGGSVDVRDVCPSGQARRIEVTRRLWAYAASLGTLGLYLPHQVRVTCRER